MYKFIEKGIYAKPMQHFKNFDWKKFLMQGVLPCLLAVAVGFISRYQLELSDGVTESFLALQWPLYAPLNALTAFCLTLILFAMLGRWWLSTALSGAVFTIIALINYYTRDLHGSALMPQDILNLGTAAEVMGSYTLKITHDVIKIALLFLPILAIAFVQRRLCKGAPKRASWPARGVRVAGSALCVFLVMFFGYFGPVTVKPKTTYGWAWQNSELCRACADRVHRQHQGEAGRQRDAGVCDGGDPHCRAEVRLGAERFNNRKKRWCKCSDKLGGRVEKRGPHRDR